MNYLTIRGIDKKFTISNGNIYNIDIENSTFYNKLVSDLYYENTETFVFLKNMDIIDYNKETLFLNDIYTLSPNSKKILNSLYKKLQDNFNQKTKEELILINQYILEILKKIEMEINVSVDYLSELDLSTLLTMYKFMFKENNDCILDRIVTFIKANQEIKNFSLIISLNLLPLLNDDELILLKKELELLGLSIININLRVKTNKKIVDNITIDDDLCVF